MTARRPCQFYTTDMDTFESSDFPFDHFILGRHPKEPIQPDPMRPTIPRKRFAPLVSLQGVALRGYGVKDHSSKKNEAVFFDKPSEALRAMAKLLEEKGY